MHFFFSGSTRPGAILIRKIRMPSWIYSSGGWLSRDLARGFSDGIRSSPISGGLMQTSRNGYEPPKWSVALTALASLLLVGGCQNGQGRQAAPAPAPEVATVKVSLESVVLTTELPGRTSAYLAAEIRPQVNGIIRKRLFTEG